MYLLFSFFKKDNILYVISLRKHIYWLNFRYFVYFIHKRKVSGLCGAGTTLDNDKIVSNGGRVLAITSLAETFQEALKISYKNINKISFDKMYYRKDIGFDL